MLVAVTSLRKVLQFVHSDPITGHFGYERTMQRSKRDFY
jgi:hypothetical protein